jgi:hypothetical protein
MKCSLPDEMLATSVALSRLDRPSQLQSPEEWR